MKRKIFFLSFFIVFIVNAQLINRALVVPEFGNHLIRTYYPTSNTTIAVNPVYTIDLTTLPNGLSTTGSPNCTAMFGSDLFVTITGANQRIYKFPNYGNNPINAIANVSQITNISNDYVGIIFDTSGNLYVSEGSYLDTHIVKYTVLSNYTTRIDLGNGGLISYFANFAFDTSGNLWASDYRNNRIVAIEAMNLNTSNTSFHSCLTNTTTWGTTGGHNENINSVLQAKNITKAFSQPEGLAFDSNGRLWVANNNDSGTNEAPTLVRISFQMLNDILANTSFEAHPNLTNSIYGYQVWNLPSSTSGIGQFGGMQIDQSINRIYVNEQISGSGMWFDIATLSNVIDNFSNYQLNITSTNPGNGGMFLANSGQILENQSYFKSKSITFYPNPSNGLLSIQSGENIKEILAYNILGKEIKLEILNTNKIFIEEKGIYLLKIIFENGQISYNKIIID